MNKVVKTSALIAFAAIFSVFSVKPAAAIDFSKTIGKIKDDAVKSATNNTVKAVNKAIESKPIKEIQITGIPSEYEGYYAMIMASVPEASTDICMPSYLTLGASALGATEGAIVDTVKAGAVKVSTPCDDKKRLIVLTLTKTRGEKNTEAGGFIYAKDAGNDVCKSKAAMPIYKLSEKQTFSFGDFIKNETCKNIADGVAKIKK